MPCCGMNDYLTNHASSPSHAALSRCLSLDKNESRDFRCLARKGVAEDLGRSLLLSEGEFTPSGLFDVAVVLDAKPTNRRSLRCGTCGGKRLVWL